jgi:hypothetical protein
VVVDATVFTCVKVTGLMSRLVQRAHSSVHV